MIKNGKKYAQPLDVVGDNLGFFKRRNALNLFIRPLTSISYIKIHFCNYLKKSV